MAYDLASVDLPRMTGTPLRLFASALEGGLVRAALMPKILRDAGADKLRAMELEETPTYTPISFDTSGAGEEPITSIDALISGATSPAPLARVRDFAAAYRSGRTTPIDVADRLIHAIEASRQGPHALGAVLASSFDDLRAQARASTRRFEAKRPLGVLDGVPVGIKDELDQAGYPTTVGTRFMGRAPCAEDATPVARLRKHGALLFAKLNMNEIGINPDGGNMHHGLVRNPHALAHDTGGSSSGSAAAVAAGLCPIALGADGGGSIRIPAALCGVPGLKATFGRISEHGAAPLCWTVGHVGPIAATIEDLAIAYAVIAGPDPRDPSSLHQPAPSLEGWNSRDVRGLVIGVYEPWFQHASPEIVAACEAALRQLEIAGATIASIELPDLDATRIAHAITILSEMTTSMDRFRDDSSGATGTERFSERFALPTRVNLAIGRSFTASDYVKAQQVRTRAIANVRAVFEQVDLIATPTTAITAPKIPVHGPREGWSDLVSTTEVMRFAFLGNATGIPALTVPVGADRGGLPIGLQLMARPWAEHQLFRAALTVEERVSRPRARTHYDLLP
ncbi:amidase [Myxococcota bacterium]|nr:amidase [Myxococcota bacterium]